jgi:hypothetical protein
MWLKRKNTEYEKNKGSFVRGWTILQRDGKEVHLIENKLTKEIIETEAQEVVSI